MKCHNNTALCVSCFRYCDNGSADVDNGRMLCSHCKQHIIKREDSWHIVKFINDIYEDAGLGRIIRWNLVVVDYNAMVSLSKATNVRGLARRRNDEMTIYVYRYLSNTSFAETLAHEMLHIWQYERNIKAKKELSEGFCNLGSYVTLKKIGTQDANNFIRYMESNPDPFYGEGFRRMKKEYDKGGWNLAIKLLIS